VLAQQIVAETALQKNGQSGLFELCRGPTRTRPSKSQFDMCRDARPRLRHAAWRRGALLHYDSLNHKLRARKAPSKRDRQRRRDPRVFDYRVCSSPKVTSSAR